MTQDEKDKALYLASLPGLMANETENDKMLAWLSMYFTACHG